jgi:uncharacterized protein (DUF58 family)
VKRILNIYFSNRFWYALIAITALFFSSHFLSFLMPVAKLFALFVIIVVFIDILLILSGKIIGERIVPEKFSNGDKNIIKYKIQSLYKFPILIDVFDDLPLQFQLRDFKFSLSLKMNEIKEKDFEIRPVTRGVYRFEYVNVFCKTQIGLIQRRFKAHKAQEVAVFPSFVRLKETEMMALVRSNQHFGLKKMYRIGNNKEFEQIKEYVSGDDYRKLNWKATARHNKLMVNEYQDERSQDVYQLIDMGRSMKMPFNGMTLLDYSINAALALANIILKKNDKTGLITYTTHIQTFIKSDDKKTQIHKLFQSLYAQKTSFRESNLETVYTILKKNTSGRSLLILYTNYESVVSFERQLSILKKLSKNHLILLVSFVNNDLIDLVKTKAKNTQEIYRKVLAEKTINEKTLFMNRLNRYGIINLNVEPDKLDIAVLNKYLEIKNRGLI